MSPVVTVRSTILLGITNHRFLRRVGLKLIGATDITVSIYARISSRIATDIRVVKTFMQIITVLISLSQFRL
jgi:hypothetical protein